MGCWAEGRVPFLNLIPPTPLPYQGRGELGPGPTPKFPLPDAGRGEGIDAVNLRRCKKVESLFSSVRNDPFVAKANAYSKLREERLVRAGRSSRSLEIFRGHEGYKQDAPLGLFSRSQALPGNAYLEALPRPPKTRQSLWKIHPPSCFLVPRQSLGTPTWRLCLSPLKRGRASGRYIPQALARTRGSDEKVRRRRSYPPKSKNF